MIISTIEDVPDILYYFSQLQIYCYDFKGKYKTNETKQTK